MRDRSLRLVCCFALQTPLRAGWSNRLAASFRQRSPISSRSPSRQPGKLTDASSGAGGAHPISRANCSSAKSGCRTSCTFLIAAVGPAMIGLLAGDVDNVFISDLSNQPSASAAAGSRPLAMAWPTCSPFLLEMLDILPNWLSGNDECRPRGSDSATPAGTPADNHRTKLAQE